MSTLTQRARDAAERAVQDGRIKRDDIANYMAGYIRVRPDTTEKPKMKITTKLLQTATTTQLQDAPTKELLAWYNAHAESTVKKFSSRAIAIKRCQTLAAELKPEKNPCNPKRTAGAKASWEDKDVAAARAKRHNVAARKKGTKSEEIYRSVRTAFKELGLPDKDHQKFRQELVAYGEAEYENYEFRVVASA